MKSNTFAIQNLNSLLNLIVFLSPINKYNRYEENNFNVYCVAYSIYINSD